MRHVTGISHTIVNWINSNSDMSSPMEQYHTNTRPKCRDCGEPADFEDLSFDWQCPNCETANVKCDLCGEKHKESESEQHYKFGQICPDCQTYIKKPFDILRGSIHREVKDVWPGN